MFASAARSQVQHAGLERKGSYAAGSITCTAAAWYAGRTASFPLQFLHTVCLQGFSAAAVAQPTAAAGGRLKDITSRSNNGALYHLLRWIPVLLLFLGLHNCHHAAWLLWFRAHCSCLHRCAVLTGLLGLPTGAAVGGPPLSHYYTEGKKQEVRTRLTAQGADHDMPHGHNALCPNLQLPPAACADRSSMQEGPSLSSIHCMACPLVHALQVCCRIVC
jgi:hypothetical protein